MYDVVTTNVGSMGDSNTTLVKVKWRRKSICYCLYRIQIQHLLKLNNKDKNGKTLEIKFKYNTC